MKSTWSLNKESRWCKKNQFEIFSFVSVFYNILFQVKMPPEPKEIFGLTDKF